MGWSLGLEEEYFNFNTIITNDLILYANWEMVNSGGDEETGIDLNVYYSGITNQVGQQLKQDLNTIIRNGFEGLSYNSANTILNLTDKDPNNPSNVILIYSGYSVSGEWDNGLTWNKEHVWPQSLLGVKAGGVNSASNLHNLKPANPSYNPSRGNNPFTNELLIKGEPVREEVRGDIARILFYMVVMYPEYNLVDRALVVYEMAYLQTLLQWHESDPVDDFEMNRNNIIYHYQGNRNPFIDRPYYVERMFSVTIEKESDHTYYINVEMVYDPYLERKERFIN